MNGLSRIWIIWIISKVNTETKEEKLDPSHEKLQYLINSYANIHHAHGTSFS